MVKLKKIVTQYDPLESYQNQRKFGQFPGTIKVLWATEEANRGSHRKA